MIKKIAAILIFFTAVQGTLAKQHTPDSLKKQLLLARDTSRVLLLAKLVSYYALNTPDSAFKYGSQGLKLARESHYPKGEAVMLDRLGFLYRETGNLPKALDFALKSLTILQKGNYLEEKQYTFILFGTIYHDLRDYQKSNSYYLQSKVIAEKLGDQIGVNADLLNVASNYIELGNTDSAGYYINKAYVSYVKLNAINNDTYLWRDMGRLQFKLGNYDRALADLKKALLISLNQQDHRNAAYNYTQLAEVFEKRGKDDSVIFYSKLGLQEGKTGPFNLFILKSSAQLVNAFKNKSDFKSALFYEELLQNTKESLFGADNIQAINKLITDDNGRKKEVEDQKIAYKNQVKQYILLVSVAVILLIASILYRSYKKQQKANNLLHQQKEEINTALLQLKSTQTQLIQSEKMASLGELTAGIAHEIQNPLNFVNNFSEVNTEMIAELETELQAGNLSEALAITADIKENELKITYHGKRADFIVKGMLQHSRTSTGERQLTNINLLADEFLKLSYHGLRAKDKNFNAELVTNFDENLPHINVVQQDIGRVLLNLFNNAFYAVNERRKLEATGWKPEVTVTTSVENNQVLISVKDNGNGIPDAIKDKIMQPFFTTKPTGEGTGLGLSLSYDIVVKGHGGSIKVERAEGGGSKFSIILPLAN